MHRTITIIGGGQLGRMLTQAALPLGLHVTVVDEASDCPAAQVGAAVELGSIRDAAVLRRAAERSEVTTWEVEHIDAAALVDLEAAGFEIAPSPSALLRFQDKLEQKRLLRGAGLPLGPFADLREPAELDAWIAEHGPDHPVIAKRRLGAFDGRGNETTTLGALRASLASEVGFEADWYAELVLPFDAEFALLSARDASGTISHFPLTRTSHEHGICVALEAPAGVAAELEERAQQLARSVMAHFDGAGVFCVEFFLVDGELLVNEVAPRVHNSGHHTIEACETSQFEQHMRCVAGLPLGATTLRYPAVVTVNILGPETGEPAYDRIPEILRVPGLHLHLYGKTSRPRRKIGHLTVGGDSLDEVRALAVSARKELTGS